MQFKVQQNEFSSMTQYPNNYKFMSADFVLNMDVQYTDRTSYDLLNMMGDVGGVLEVLVILFQLIASPFAIIRIKAILANRLFNITVRNL